MGIAPLTVFSVFLIGVVASWIGSIVGGGGLLSIPFLIFVGLPPSVAIATNKLGALGLRIGAIPTFKDEGKIIWRHVLPLSAITFMGAILGAVALVNIESALLSSLVGVFVLALLPMIFIRPDIGEKRLETSAKKEYLGYFSYFLVAVYLAFFGGGAGILARYAIIFFFGTTIIESTATHMIPSLVSTVVALTVFAFNGIINYQHGLILLLGMVAGGRLGAHTAVQKGERWVKILFALVVMVSAIKLILF